MLTGWLFGVPFSTVGLMFSRTAETVRLYLYHNRYVLSFFSLGSGSGRGGIPITAVPGCPNTGVRPVGWRFTPGRGRAAGGWDSTRPMLRGRVLFRRVAGP